MYNDNQPYILPAVPRIICIGDVHGDLGRLTDLLRTLHIIDSDTRWIAEPRNTILIQLGDQLDSMSRGSTKDWETVPDTDVIRFMDDLDKIARKSGGRVLSLIGNHELMNVLGDFSYVSTKSMQLSGGISRRAYMFRVGGPMARVLSKRNMIVRIGGVTFCHGGILPHHLDILRDNIGVVNEVMRKYLYALPLDPHEVFVLENIIIGFEGILWTRRYFELLASGNMEMLQDVMRNVCSRLQCNSVVVGHNTVQHITGAANGALWLIDAALSRAYGGDTNEVLEILNDDDPAQPTQYRTLHIQKND